MLECPEIPVGDFEEEPLVEFGTVERLLPRMMKVNEIGEIVMIAERIGHSPRPSEYEAERWRIQAEKRSVAEIALLPTVDVIRKRHGIWNAALDQAGAQFKQRRCWI